MHLFRISIAYIFFVSFIYFLFLFIMFVVIKSIYIILLFTHPYILLIDIIVLSQSIPFFRIIPFLLLVLVSIITDVASESGSKKVFVT